MTAKQLKEAGAGDTHPAWIEAQKAVENFRKHFFSSTSSPAKVVEALDNLEKVIQPHYRAAMAEKKATQYIDQKARIADKERRLLVDRQQMITIEKAMLFITAVIMGLRESVFRYVDKPTANKILRDTNEAYSRAIGSGQDIPTVDG